MRNVMWCLLVVFAMAGCTRPLNNVYDRMVLDCGASSREMRPDAQSAVLQFLSPGGRGLLPEEVKGLVVELEGPEGATSSLTPSPKGCVTVPAEKGGLLKARVAERGWALVHGYAGFERGALPRTLSLGTEVSPRVELECPSGGFHAARRLGVALTLGGIPDDRGVRFSLRLAPRGGGDALAVFTKEFGRSLDSSPSLDLESVPEGTYELSAVAEGLTGLLALEGTTPSCPVRIDRTAPSLIEKEDLAHNAVVTQSVGSFERMEAMDSDGAPAEVLTCQEKLNAKGTPLASPPVCDDVKNFQSGNVVTFEQAGFWRVFSFARDGAGNASSTSRRDYRIDGAAPVVEVRWEDPELNRVGAVVLGGKRNQVALIHLGDDVSSFDELAANLECKVLIKVAGTGATVEGDFAECRNGVCKGESFERYIPCGGEVTDSGDVRVRISQHGSYDEMHQSLFVFSARVRDGLGRMTETRTAFWNAFNEGFAEWSPWYYSTLYDENAPPENRGRPRQLFKMGDANYLVFDSGIEKRKCTTCSEWKPFPEDLRCARSLHWGVYAPTASELVVVRCGAYSIFDGERFSEWRTPEDGEHIEGQVVSMKRDGEGRLWAILERGERPLALVDSTLYRGMGRPSSSGPIEFLPSRSGLWIFDGTSVASLSGYEWKDFPLPVKEDGTSYYGHSFTGGGVLSDGSVWIFMEDSYLVLRDGKWRAHEVGSLPRAEQDIHPTYPLFIGATRLNESTMVAITAGPYHAYMFRGDEVRCVSCDYVIPNHDGLPRSMQIVALRQHTWLDKPNPEPQDDIGAIAMDGNVWIPRGATLQKCDWDSCQTFAADGVGSGALFPGNDGYPISLGGENLSQLVPAVQSAPGWGQDERFVQISDGSRFWSGGRFVRVEVAGRWVLLRTPLGRNCGEELYSSPEFFHLGGVFGSFNGGLLMEYCGTVQRLGRLGWEVVTPHEGRYPDPVRGNFAKLTDFVIGCDGEMWALSGTTEAEVFQFSEDVWRHVGNLPFPSFWASIVALGKGELFVFDSSGHRAIVRNGQVLPLSDSRGAVPASARLLETGEVLGEGKSGTGEVSIFELDRASFEWILRESQ